MTGPRAAAIAAGDAMTPRMYETSSASTSGDDLDRVRLGGRHDIGVVGHRQHLDGAVGVERAPTWDGSRRSSPDWRGTTSCRRRRCRRRFQPQRLCCALRRRGGPPSARSASDLPAVEPESVAPLPPELSVVAGRRPRDVAGSALPPPLQPAAVTSAAQVATSMVRKFESEMFMGAPLEQATRQCTLPAFSAQRGAENCGASSTEW